MKAQTIPSTRPPAAARNSLGSVCRLGLLLWFCSLALRLAAAEVTLPASAALPTDSVSNPGFVVRTAQASNDVVVANSAVRARKQIHGTLTDAAGNPVVNIASPGPNRGFFDADAINYEKDAMAFDVMTDYGATRLCSFSPNFFPGIPGTEGNTTKESGVGLTKVFTLERALGQPQRTQRTQRKKLEEEMVFTQQVVGSIFPAACFSLCSLHCNASESSQAAQISRRFSASTVQRFNDFGCGSAALRSLWLNCSV